VEVEVVAQMAAAVMAVEMVAVMVLAVVLAVVPVMVMVMVLSRADATLLPTPISVFLPALAVRHAPQLLLALVMLSSARYYASKRQFVVMLKKCLISRPIKPTSTTC